jgi:hypothetical protein
MGWNIPMPVQPPSQNQRLGLAKLSVVRPNDLSKGAQKFEAQVSLSSVDGFRVLTFAFEIKPQGVCVAICNSIVYGDPIDLCKIVSGLRISLDDVAPCKASHMP